MAVHRTIGGIACRGKSYLFALDWVTESGKVLVGEVFPVSGAGRLRQDIVDAITHAAPAPRIDLDPVASRIWEEITEIGLPFVLRGLSLWWWVESLGELASVPEEVMATGVVRLVAGGGRNHKRKVDAASIIDGSYDIGNVVKELKRLIRAHDRPW